ncbi:MAG: hypothetical protein JWO52_2353 [Gammaproteobacteria bacterium]|nr:hypothetical protein [Gammaproteobacteria bacterium]
MHRVLKCHGHGPPSAEYKRQVQSSVQHRRCDTGAPCRVLSNRHLYFARRALQSSQAMTDNSPAEQTAGKNDNNESGSPRRVRIVIERLRRWWRRYARTGNYVESRHGDRYICSRNEHPVAACRNTDSPLVRHHLCKYRRSRCGAAANRDTHAWRRRLLCRRADDFPRSRGWPLRGQLPGKSLL